MDADTFPMGNDWRKGVDERLLRRLWRRAEQPGLIPMQLPGRILSRLREWERRLEWATQLVRRYTVGAGFNTDLVPIVHAFPSPVSALSPIQPPVLVERLITRALVTSVSQETASSDLPSLVMPTARPLDPTPLASRSVSAVAMSDIPAPSEHEARPSPTALLLPIARAATSDEVQSPVSPPSPVVVLPLPPSRASLPPVDRTATSREVHSPESPLPSVVVLPSPRPGASLPPVTGIVASREGQSPPSPRPEALPALRVTTSREAQAPRSPPSYAEVLPLPPTSAMSPVMNSPSGEGAPTLPLTRPLPTARVAPPSDSSARPSLPIAQVMPQPLSENPNRQAMGVPLVLPSSPVSRSSQGGEATPPADRTAAVRTASPEQSSHTSSTREQGVTPSPRPTVPPRLEIDLDALANRVRQRLLRHSSEEKVRRGGLR